MKKKARLIVGLVMALAGIVLTLAAILLDSWPWGDLLLWTAICMMSELFWLKTPSGDSVQTLAATAKLSSIMVLSPWAALIVIFVSTVSGNFLFRRSKWYRAIYNGSQLVLAGAVAALVVSLFGVERLQDAFHLPAAERAEWVADVAVDRRFLSAFLSAGLVYILVNNTIMSFLMSEMTGRRISLLWRENCLYPAEVQSSLTLLLLSPLLVILFGGLGILGLAVLFVCLALVHQANRRYLAVVGAQNEVIRSERMAAMGEMAEEIGRSLGKHLGDLKVLANRLLEHAKNTQGEKVVKSAEIIYTNTDRMGALVGGLAAFSHQETHKVQIDLNELIERTVDFVRPQNRFDGIHMKVTPDPILPSVNVDPAQMQQVFINLLTNAADALAERTGLKKITIDTRYDPNLQKIQVTFTDNGPGIPPAILDRIFEPHFTTKATGHGFGLATVFRIAQNHKGRVTAMNVPNSGARFLVEIPNA